MAPTDAELVAAANAGDGGSAAAFDILVRRHEAYVLRVARRFCGDDELARDAAQETFLYLLGRFPPPRSNRLVLTAKLTTLLYPVAKHAALHAKVRRDRLRPPEAHESAAPETDDGSLEHLIGGLSGDHREVVLLRFVDGLTVPEIAERVGVPAGTVKSRLHAAVAALRADPRVRAWIE